LSDKQTIQWKRISVEAIAIVASILLAFAIDAWWAEQAEERDELESLSLIHRDLLETEEQLRDYIAYAQSAAQSAVNAYVALSRPGPYDRDYIKTELFRVDRRTVRIPRAAYQDLLSTGNLRIIEDRLLRDSIIRFYEDMERTELIIRSNNEAFLDGMLNGIYYGEGLLLPLSPNDVRVASVNTANRSIFEKLPEDVRTLPDPLWQLSSDSREWQRLRAAVLLAAGNHSLGAILAKDLLNQATSLADAVRSQE
jgi:hypothetical protein